MKTTPINFWEADQQGYKDTRIIDGPTINNRSGCSNIQMFSDDV